MLFTLAAFGSSGSSAQQNNKGSEKNKGNSEVERSRRCVEFVIGRNRRSKLSKLPGPPLGHTSLSSVIAGTQATAAELKEQLEWVTERRRLLEVDNKEGCCFV
ncbi:hypothetical protein B0H14DRAFT_2576542 [Mycena olivaceomarginata]|nr:hypothetical protein B0H14DRAFT_2576542 [Mycena olivaceomarginata]